MDECHIRKQHCLHTHACAGKNYSVFDGIFDTCGRLNPFEIWNRFVDESKSERDLALFMDHYDIPPFEAPDSASRPINAFFQAKYGMFYCYDNNKRYGLIDYDPSLIAQWEKNSRKLKRTWNLAVMAALSDKSITFNQLEIYRKKDFKKSKSWRKYEKRKEKTDYAFNK